MMLRQFKECDIITGVGKLTNGRKQRILKDIYIYTHTHKYIYILIHLSGCHMLTFHIYVCVYIYIYEHMCVCVCVNKLGMWQSYIVLGELNIHIKNTPLIHHM